MGKENEYRRNVAMNFYQNFCAGQGGRVPYGEVDYIDFNYPVRDIKIEKGTRLWGFKDPRISPFRSPLFGIPGTPISILGVHHQDNLKSDPRMKDRILNEYEVLVTIPNALESVCAEGVDSWTQKGAAHVVKGGGWQYKVPHPERYVRSTTPFPKRFSRAGVQRAPPLSRFSLKKISQSL